MPNRASDRDSVPSGPFTGTRIGATVYLAGQTESLVNAKYAGGSVSENIILGEEIRGRCQDGNADIAKGVQAAVLIQTSCRSGSSRKRSSDSAPGPAIDLSLAVAHRREILAMGTAWSRSAA